MLPFSSSMSSPSFSLARTSVTHPSSASGSSSISSKMRPAPATPSTALFICCAVCVIEEENCLMRLRKDMSVPTVVMNIPSPKSAMAPPTTATIRYSRLPKADMMGIMTVAMPLALSEFSYSSSLSFRICSRQASSWLKTFTTLRPPKISSE